MPFFRSTRQSVMSYDWRDHWFDFLTAIITDYAAQPVTYNLSLPAGKSVTIDWGDGETNAVVGPISEQDYVHNYTANGDYQVRLRGDYKSLTRLDCKDQTWIGGSTASLCTLTGLTHLYFGSTSITGTTSDLATLTGLTHLYFYNTSITGTTSDLATLTGLTVLNFWGTSVTYSSAATPEWHGKIYCYHLGWLESDVDGFLSECVAAGYSDGTLNISGTNAPPSAAGLADRDTLVSRGWTVTVST